MDWHVGAGDGDVPPISFSSDRDRLGYLAAAPLARRGLAGLNCRRRCALDPPETGVATAGRQCSCRFEHLEACRATVAASPPPASSTRRRREQIFQHWRSECAAVVERQLGSAAPEPLSTATLRVLADERGFAIRGGPMPLVTTAAFPRQPDSARLATCRHWAASCPPHSIRGKKARPAAYKTRHRMIQLSTTALNRQTCAMSASS